MPAAERATGSDRLAYACVLAVVTPLGFLTKLYAGPGADWVSASAGGFFYVLFWVFLFLCLSPSSSPGAVARWVLAITCLLELLQLWRPPFLESIRSSFLGHALLGSTFSWSDFAYYVLGALVAPALARRALRAAAARSGTLRA